MFNDKFDYDRINGHVAIYNLYNALKMEKEAKVDFQKALSLNLEESMAKKIPIKYL